MESLHWKARTQMSVQCPGWCVVHTFQDHVEGIKALHTPELQHRETPWGHLELQHPGETELLVVFPVHFSVFANFFYIDLVQLRKDNKHCPIMFAELFSIRHEEAQHTNITLADRGRHWSSRCFGNTAGLGMGSGSCFLWSGSENVRFSWQ